MNIQTSLITEQNLQIPLPDVQLEGIISIPANIQGLVIFAHGSGSSRHSPRNQWVAKHLQQNGLGTFLFDLLSAEEEKLDAESAQLRFDIPWLGQRLSDVTHWLIQEMKSQFPSVANLPKGYFGASTGAAAAFIAATQQPEIRAIVSRGGRPDLAGFALSHIQTPTLFLVGENDATVLQLNQFAMEQLPKNTAHKLVIVPKATHLFAEPGALEVVAQEAVEWFKNAFK